jgi:hypothetical protein
MDNKPGSNFMDVGHYRDEAMENKDHLVWVDALEDYFWTTWISGVNFKGGIGLEDAYKMEPRKLFFDSGSTYSYIPPEYFYFIMSRLLSEITALGYTYRKNRQLNYVFDCNAKYYLSPI